MPRLNEALTKIVDKIQDEPFLFVLGLAIVLLLLATSVSGVDPNLIVLILGVLAVASLVGFEARDLRRQRLSSPLVAGLSGAARRFWAGFAKAELQVVLGRFPASEQFEASRIVGAADAVALPELASFLAAIHLPPPIISYGDQTSGEDLKADLVLIGGPDVNEVTALVSARLASSISFGDASRHEVAFHDKRTNEVYCPLADASGEIVRDFGLVIRARNPFATGRRVVVIAGSFGYGTLAALRFATSSGFFEDAEGADQVECLIEVEVFRASPQQPKLVLMRPLPA